MGQEDHLEVYGNNPRPNDDTLDQADVEKVWEMSVFLVYFEGKEDRIFWWI